MKNFLYSVAVGLSLFLYGCQSNHRGDAGAQTVQKEAAPAKEKKDPERKLLKEGSIAFETDDPAKTSKSIREAVKKHEGYIASDQESKQGGRVSTSLLIRVPSERFDDLINDIARGVERFDQKSIEVKDVTEEFIDIEARLKTQKELEARYLELLKQAKNVTEILETEKQIGVLRGEIESMEGRLKYLTDRVAYSTLQVTFYKEVPDRTRLSREFGESFRNGWDNLIAFFVLLTNLWPFILIIVGVIFGLRSLRRRKKRKKFLNSDEQSS